MWIQTVNTDSAGEPVTRRLRTADGLVVEFSSNGKANVKKDVGEQLIDRFESITAVEEDADDESGGGGDDADAETSDS